jgi:AcrR family transcriptional regulator
MKSEKTNRKIKYTKMVIKDSFIKLLKQKSISRITITEICKEADVNRATFYAYYTDQFDLLKQIELELVDDINQYIKSYSFNENDSEFLQMMNQIFEYIKDNSELCELLLSDKGDLQFKKDIMLIVQRQCISEWTTKKSLPIDVAEYLYSFATNGSIGLIVKWLQEGMTRSTREMAEMVIRLTNQGLLAFVQSNN